MGLVEKASVVSYPWCQAWIAYMGCSDFQPKNIKRAPLDQANSPSSPSFYISHNLLYLSGICLMSCSWHICSLYLRNIRRALLDQESGAGLNALPLEYFSFAILCQVFYGDHEVSMKLQICFSYIIVHISEVWIFYIPEIYCSVILLNTWGCHSLSKAAYHTQLNILRVRRSLLISMGMIGILVYLLIYVSKGILVYLLVYVRKERDWQNHDVLRQLNCLPFIYLFILKNL